MLEYVMPFSNLQTRRSSAFPNHSFSLLASFWTAEEVDLSKDLDDWNYKLKVCIDLS